MIRRYERCKIYTRVLYTGFMRLGSSKIALTLRHALIYNALNDVDKCSLA